MKYMKRSGIYKASNLSFDPETLQAVSYDWWVLVAVIDGKLVFNSYNYSNTTVKHQIKVRALLDELGISIDIEVECPGGLQDLESGVKYHGLKRDELLELTQKKRTRHAKNAERLEEVSEHQDSVAFLIGAMIATKEKILETAS